MNISHSVKFTSYLKGDTRVDSWKSPWRIEFERRSAEDKGKFRYISAPQIKARQERNPARICDLCPKVLRSRNKSGRCNGHAAPKVEKVKTLCPGCDKPMRSSPKFRICGKCFTKYRYLLSQTILRLCDECPTKISKNNTTGKCRMHSRLILKRKYNAMRRARIDALKKAA